MNLSITFRSSFQKSASFIIRRREFRFSKSFGTSSANLAAAQWLPVDPNFGTSAIHSGYSPKEDKFGQAVPAISVSSVNFQDDPRQSRGYFYNRMGNPTRTALQKTLAAVDKGKYGFVYSSGVAAISNIITSLLQTGDDVVIFNDLYSGTAQVFEKHASSFGMTTDYVDLRTKTVLRNALKPSTKMVWIETPSNPTLKIVDIAKTVKAVREYSKDIIVVVDNTFLTPYFQRPLTLGADLCLYSLTKYINGHSDVLMGGITTNREDLAEKLEYNQKHLGSVPSPFDCYMALRGLKTLHVRMPLHMENGLRLAKFLESHPRVTQVLHPGLPSHPDHVLALKQSSGHSSLFSFYIRGGSAEEFLKRMKLFQLMVSLGGTESIACSPSLQTHKGVPKEVREEFGITDNLVRVSVGLESAEELIKDLDQALNGLE